MSKTTHNRNQSVGASSTYFEHQMDFLALNSLMQKVGPLEFGSQPHLHFLPNNVPDSRDNTTNIFVCG